MQCDHKPAIRPWRLTCQHLENRIRRSSTTWQAPNRTLAGGLGTRDPGTPSQANDERQSLQAKISQPGIYSLVRIEPRFGNESNRLEVKARVPK
jgi:hypothetical protein